MGREQYTIYQCLCDWLIRRIFQICWHPDRSVILNFPDYT